MIIAGVDEAGKGPVLGSLVICAASIDKKDLLKLEHINVKDSKLLKKEEREALYEDIIKIVKDYKLSIIDPEEIDDNILRNPNSNLNKLEAVKTSEILKQLNPDKAYVDCPDINTERHKARLNLDCELVVEHKAEKYAIVAAASIIAKVIRDRKMAELRNIHKMDFGSGYCSDPKTKVFMDEHWNNKLYSHLIRKSWSTFQRKKVASEQKSLGSF
ncbi:ribonuclease HII [Candidatus Woesearchaeota archaeon]|jgi:ribonuclease HII|nr:ribonuclease HII [Candidatus Woesearchaeota archaeon]MBT4368526.1 ribonuclease HII [Candidatus Woesearchaeota archaeon]MBT4713015.1 ribonuclease HII [Candidatus Woesearchaeota archaeon]MBT6639927.1 ribonuclease HII [Candidatus Woesearchaeota archaeon]MBT7134099.1 ribonuclease HII [Candidatus Woesearchaeota archaeon]